MKMHLYQTTDDEIVLNKTLENEKEIDINFKANYNKLDTKLILNYKQGNFDANYYNYVKIENVYFFIVKKDFIDNENVIYYLHQDVYMSNQNIVKKRIYGVLDRSGSNFNRYINDTELCIASQKRVQTKAFAKSFKFNNNAVLVVTSK